MSLFDRVAQALALEPWSHPPLQTLSTDEALLAEIARTRAIRQAAARPWRPASIHEALGVPAIFGAVTLISNVASTLTLQAFQNGNPVPDDQRPRLIVRPNPFTTLREFIRASVYNSASRGENLWWVAQRDADGYAMSLLPLHPPEVTLDMTQDELRPRISWRGKQMPNDDIRQMVLSREPPDLRGRGALQACGAAISVAVESQEWAANQYSETGGHPSINLHSEPELTVEEAAALREQWVQTPANTPQVTSGPLTLTEFGANAAAGQMLEARNWSVGEVARMFNIPGSLLEYSMTGASLTYTNRSDLWGEFLERCLYPNYLEPMEQEISDLLPRTWTARFNTKSLLRADIKTRYDVHKIAIETGIYGPEVAQGEEGYGPGDIENAPVPFSPPQAFPTAIPAGMPITLMNDFRCPKCDRKLAEVAAHGTRIRCRCGDLAVA